MTTWSQFNLVSWQKNPCSLVLLICHVLLHCNEETIFVFVLPTDYGIAGSLEILYTCSLCTESWHSNIKVRLASLTLRVMKSLSNSLNVNLYAYLLMAWIDVSLSMCFSANLQIHSLPCTVLRKSAKFTKGSGS